MSHFLLLGLEVGEGIWIWHGFTRELRDYIDAFFRQSSGFARVVRGQTNFVDAEMARDRRRPAEVLKISLEPQRMIGLYRIKPDILRLVCLQFCDQANVATFPILVDHKPSTFFGDSLHGRFQPIATVALQRTEHFSGDALRMNPLQRSPFAQVAHDKRERCLNLSTAIPDIALETDGIEYPPPGWYAGGRNSPQHAGMRCRSFPVFVRGHWRRPHRRGHGP